MKLISPYSPKKSKKIFNNGGTNQNQPLKNLNEQGQVEFEKEFPFKDK
jgi:hypothetical protein